MKHYYSSRGINDRFTKKDKILFCFHRKEWSIELKYQELGSELDTHRLEQRCSTWLVRTFQTE